MAGETEYDLSPENDFRKGPFNHIGMNLQDSPPINAQSAQSESDITAQEPHVYTDEENAWLDSLGSHPAD